MGVWIGLAVILAGALTSLAFWLGKKEEKVEDSTFSPKETIKSESGVVEEEFKNPKKVELHFSDGSKMVLDENSPYYQDFIDCADKILSKEEENAKERAHSSSA